MRETTSSLLVSWLVGLGITALALTNHRAVAQTPEAARKQFEEEETR